MASRIYSFPAVISPNATRLILGSMPGTMSLSEHAYYAHPRNVFWPIMASVLRFDLELPYQDRLDRLQQGQIALWDVIQTCERSGSLDTAIQSASIIPNNIPELLVAHPQIEKIFCNGTKAYALFKRYIQAQLQQHLLLSDRLIKVYQLPSTSPAHARLGFSEKLEAWRIVCD